MVIENKWGLWKSAHVILDDNLFYTLLDSGRYSYISAISYNSLKVPPTIRIRSKPTVLIDLNRKNKEEILASFHDTCRNEIRRTFKMHGLSFRADENDIDKIYHLYLSFRRQRKLVVRRKNFLLSANNAVAYYQGRPIAAVTYYDAFPYLRVQNIFSLPTTDGSLRKIIGYATRRLVFEICAKNAPRGYVSLDLAGINMKDPLKKGITSFKCSFGGRVAVEYLYTFMSRPLRFILSAQKRISF